MGTVVTIRVVGHDANEAERAEREAGVARALEWFTHITAQCSRFDPASELSRLATQVGVAVPASTLLFESLKFALAVATDTKGAFDPTVGHRLEERGFDTDYQTGIRRRSTVDPTSRASYRDIVLDDQTQTITLTTPMVLDLGAVVKGLAIDAAALELAPFENFAIDAGGDIYVAGSNASGGPWIVGIRHPRKSDELIDSLSVSNTAVCTSGDYVRRGAEGTNDHHIVNARTGDTALSSASATVIAPTAIVADALATAAFILGPTEGIALLERHGVEGLIFTPSLERHRTAVMVSS
ncbi:MAG: FAD:protein transferase [Gemmatimonadetes bacterium]|nr:FAD:protein transferase [Gemmatimonadota bacterium]